MLREYLIRCFGSATANNVGKMINPPVCFTGSDAKAKGGQFRKLSQNVDERLHS
jgi:hypothetical protein